MLNARLHENIHEPEGREREKITISASLINPSGQSYLRAH